MRARATLTFVLGAAVCVAGGIWMIDAGVHGIKLFLGFCLLGIPAWFLGVIDDRTAILTPSDAPPAPRLAGYYRVPRLRLPTSQEIRALAAMTPFILLVILPRAFSMDDAGQPSAASPWPLVGMAVIVCGFVLPLEKALAALGVVVIIPVARGIDADYEPSSLVSFGAAAIIGAWLLASWRDKRERKAAAG